MEIGCGAGELFFPVFEAMGGEGLFLAAEWEEEAVQSFLARLESWSDFPGYTRIEVVRSKPDRLPLPDRCVDLILLEGVYHRQADRGAYLRELRRLLPPGGVVCLLEPEPESGAEEAEWTPWPRPGRPVSEERACAELHAAGFCWPVAHAGFAGRWCLTARRSD